MIEATENTFRQIIKTQGTCLVNFTASWCAPCHSMQPALRQLEQTTQIVVVAVDVQRCPNLASSFNVKSVPTLVLMGPDGEVRRQVGSQNLSSLQSFVGAP